MVAAAVTETERRVVKNKGWKKERKNMDVVIDMATMSL